MVDPGGGRRREALLDSDAMAPVDGSVVVDVPPAEFWEVFARPDLWPEWNDSFCWVRNRDLVRGERLVWLFEPIRPVYLYRMPAVAEIVVREERSRVTWEVGSFPGFYALHTYYLEPAEGGGTRFGSWEKAMGWSFRALKGFWLAHFEFVNRCSLDGARRLEDLRREAGELAPGRLERGLAA